MIHENASHDGGRNSEKVRPALPVDLFQFGEPEISLMNQRRRLQGVMAAFVAQTRRGDPAKLLVNKRYEPLFSRFVSSFQLEEELSNISRPGLHCADLGEAEFWIMFCISFFLSRKSWNLRFIRLMGSRHPPNSVHLSCAHWFGPKAQIRNLWVFETPGFSPNRSTMQFVNRVFGPFQNGPKLTWPTL